jgi:hypothetical protein
MYGSNYQTLTLKDSTGKEMFEKTAFPDRYSDETSNGTTVGVYLNIVLKSYHIIRLDGSECLSLRCDGWLMLTFRISSSVSKVFERPSSSSD